MLRKGGSVQSFSGRFRASTYTSTWQDYNVSYADQFEMVTFSNPGYRNAVGDVGSPFLLKKTSWKVVPFQSATAICEGPRPITPRVSPWKLGESVSVSDNQITVDGTRAIAQAAPSNPSFSLPVMMGELRREGLPDISGVQLWKEKTSYLRGSASEYLNLEFGWKPLISEVKNFAKAVKESEKILDSYVRNSSTKVRRRLPFPTVQNSEVYPSISVILLPAGQSRIEHGATASETEEFRSWFSGAFRYYVPVGDDTASRIRRYSSYAGKLLGVRLTPDVLWELAPWSWASDWFFNAGDVISAVSNLGQDGMVMEYGYQMASHEKTRRVSIAQNGVFASTETTFSVKRRIKASPYGFGITFDGFSDRQKAIVAALGITRVR